VADLAAVTGGPGQWPAVDDEPAAHADLAGDEQDVFSTDRRSAPQLRERAQIGLVDDGDRDGHGEGIREALSERDVPPSEVRCHRDEAVRAPDDPDDRHADPDEQVVRRSAGADLTGQLGEIGHRLVHREVAAGAIDPRELEDMATRPDDRDGERVDCDLQREDDGAVRDQADQRRRPPRGPAPHRALLGYEAGEGELTDEAADRASRKAGPGDELGPRERSATVQLADDGAQVRTANRLAPLPDFTPTGGHAICVPLFQILTIDSNETAAVSRDENRRVARITVRRAEGRGRSGRMTP